MFLARGLDVLTRHEALQHVRGPRVSNKHHGTRFILCCPLLVRLPFIICHADGVSATLHTRYITSRRFPESPCQVLDYLQFKVDNTCLHLFPFRSGARRGLWSRSDAQRCHAGHVPPRAAVWAPDGHGPQTPVPLRPRLRAEVRCWSGVQNRNQNTFPSLTRCMFLSGRTT